MKYLYPSVEFLNQRLEELRFFEERAQEGLRTFLGMVHGKRLKEPMVFYSL
jgi:hypothetical protein